MSIPHLSPQECEHPRLHLGTDPPHQLTAPTCGNHESMIPKLDPQTKRHPTTQRVQKRGNASCKTRCLREGTTDRLSPHQKKNIQKLRSAPNTRPSQTKEDKQSGPPGPCSTSAASSNFCAACWKSERCCACRASWLEPSLDMSGGQERAVVFVKMGSTIPIDHPPVQAINSHADTIWKLQLPVDSFVLCPLRGL